MTYWNSGHAYRVCPRLLELDPRHGQHHSRWPKCWRGDRCLADHEHGTTLIDPEGHTVNDFYWVPGGLVPEPMRCDCGRELVFVDLDDPHAPEHQLAGHVIELEAPPPGDPQPGDQA